MTKGIELVDSSLNIRQTVRNEFVASQNNAKTMYKFDLDYFKVGYVYYVQRFNEEYPKLYICEDVNESVLHLVRPQDEIESLLDKAERLNILVGEAVRENIIFTIAVPSDISIKIGV